ncbi:MULTISPECIES: hypothetical protein [Synergistaceae]|uniref:hypothetical protein n=1 Tax=Synergistaceae TaxID=649777 RepID=UPI00320DE899|nr:hypothetical protein [Synergistaceae bacterium DZ-S4]
MEKKLDRSGVLITGGFKDLVHEIAQLTEMAGGWRNFYTDDPADTMQTVFLWSRLRDESMGLFDDVPNTLLKRLEIWGDSIDEKVDRDDILQVYHGVLVDGLVHSKPMIRFRVTPDNDYFLLDYETDFPEDGSMAPKILQGHDAVDITQDWIFEMGSFHGFV